MVFVVAGIPAGIDPPDISVDAALFEFLDILNLILFGRACEFLAVISGRASQERFHRFTVGLGQDVGKIPPAPQVHCS